MKEDYGSFSKFDPSQVERYVREILKQSLPASDLFTGRGNYTKEITETPQHILVKIYIAKPAEARRVHVQAAATQVKLMLRGEGQMQLIQLPHPVIPKSCKAVYKDGVMQLQMRKQEKEELFCEIDVRYID